MKPLAPLPALVLLALAACGVERAGPPPAGSLSVADALASGPVEGFARALEPRAFDFPRDHLAHPDYRTEWWYVTGHLAAANGRRFGYQLTFFRNALAPEPPESTSAWASNEIWMAHFALTDVERGEFHAADRFSRGALGLAGAQGSPPRVWLGPWFLESAPDGSFPGRLFARDGERELELTLEATRPVLLQGEEGLSRKGREPGNASYYYSNTRLATRGWLTLAGETLEVQGSSWMDREWSTSLLEEGQVGWDWFSIALDDGRDLMLFRLRDTTGEADAGAGTLRRADGSSRSLALADFRLEPRAHWTSPASGARYPVRWRVELPAEELQLELRALIPDQELDLAFRYWEGAVDAFVGSEAVGAGYVELTGYDVPGHVR